MNVELWEPELGGMLLSGEGFGHPALGEESRDDS